MTKVSDLYLLKEYGATNISVPENMLSWMRSNHAGETGAVWIYIGASCVLWNKAVRDMAREHAYIERQHLTVMKHLVKWQHRSLLLPLWRVSGFTLGLLSALFGYTSFCITIEAVEIFVERHYQEQIDYLHQHQLSPQLTSILQRCCDEEVEHQQNAGTRLSLKSQSSLVNLWRNIVGGDSIVAVKLAKAV